MRDLKAAVAYLRSRPDVDGEPDRLDRLVHGGRLLAGARVRGADAVGRGHLLRAARHGRGVIAGLKVPLLGNFGGKDQGIPAGRASATSRSRRSRKARPWTSRSTRSAGHGFASSSDPKVFRAEDAKDADARADAFLSKVLKGSGRRPRRQGEG